MGTTSQPHLTELVAEALPAQIGKDPLPSQKGDGGMGGCQRDKARAAESGSLLHGHGQL